MRKLTAVIATLFMALAMLAIGGLVSPASANVTSPGNGAVLRGNATLSETGGFDDSTFDHCSWFGGSGGDTRLQLINSGNQVVYEQFWNTGGSRSVTIDTHSYPNGSYTVRGTITVRKNGGFLGAGCSNETRTSNVSVTIDNITQIDYTGDTTAPQNTSATVSAKLTDPNLAGNALAGRTVTFSLSGGGSVNGTTNAQGIATASLPITGPPRTATVTASFAQTSFYKGSSESSAFTVTKNTSAVTIANPAAVVHGQSTSFTATVTPGNGTGTPTGSVQFIVDGATFGSPVALVGGSASSPSTSTLSTGQHTVGASYNGDSNFFGSNASTKTQQVNKASTTTVLTSTGSPTVSGQSVTFSAKVAVVSPGTGVPGGAVQFNIDGNPAGTAVSLVGDTATLAVSNLSPGNHQVDATYNGNADYASSSSASLTHGVNRADTTLELSTSNPGAVAGEPLQFSADVSVVGPGAGTPTGQVQFAVDGVDLGAPVSLSGGSATSPVAHLGAGGHLVTANYLGDLNFAGAGDSLNQVVNAAQTTTTVSSSPNPSVVGQPVTIHAEVAPVAPATGTPQGAVRFIVDGDTVDIVDLAGGAADLQVSDLAVGGHTLQAKYLSEDPNFVTSTSQEEGHTVNKAATKTVVTTSGSPSVFGQPVTFTATVSVQAPGAGNPSGTITFTDGSTVLGTQPVSSATGEQASITVSTLSVAQHAITATYDGDDSFLGSNGSVTQKVNRAQTSMVVTSSANPSQSGQGVTFSAAVSPVAPGAGLPTGTVRFSVNGLPLGGDRPLVNGVATSTEFASLSPGVYKVTATYAGDGNFVGSAGQLDQGAGQNVTKGETVVGLSSDDPTSDYSQAVTFTATVDAVAPATRRPTGVVQFWEGGVLLGASSLEPGAADQGTATFVSSTLTAGSHEVRAVYVGNFNYNGGTATTVQDVAGVPTVTGIESSANPITYGDSVTLTAVVSEGLPAPGVPTGTVTFTEGSAVLGTGTVEPEGGRQVARITLEGLGAGDHVIKASYSGDTTFQSSVSAAYTESVQRAASGLQAKVILRNVGDNGGRVQATLTGLDGAPLAGQPVTFDSTSATDGTTLHVCDTTTDTNGYAFCDATSEALAVILFNSGYDVHFAGNANYLPADDHQTYFYSGE